MARIVCVKKRNGLRIIQKKYLILHFLTEQAARGIIRYSNKMILQHPYRKISRRKPGSGFGMASVQTRKTATRLRVSGEIVCRHEPGSDWQVKIVTK